MKIEGTVQHDTHIPMITHCDKGTMGLEQLEILKSQGTDINHICLSHVDITKNIAYIEKICDSEAGIIFDHIGRELKTGDEARIQMLSKLVKDGYEDYICLSGDMGRKEHFLSYNAKPGLRNIITTFKDKLVRVIGKNKFNKMVVDNLKKFYQSNNKVKIGIQNYYQIKKELFSSFFLDILGKLQRFLNGLQML